MDTTQTGSYQIDTLSDPVKELSRLKSQGEMFRALEINTLRKCGLKQDHNVLELGCGPGFITKILAEVASKGELISVDNDPELLKLLENENIQPPEKGFRAINASADNLPIDADWADFSYARFLLQHVPSPKDIVAEAYRCTKPGGLFCAVDSDDGLTTHYPEKPEISMLLKAAEEKQKDYGGDRFVGRKMFQLANQAGFVNVKASVLSLTTSEIPPEALFAILFGYKSSLLGNKEIVTSLIQELSAEAAKGEFLLSTGVYIVVGEKPS
ncbi:MAG: methyltransferase domain-containing protein [Sedimenticola sp.]